MSKELGSSVSTFGEKLEGTCALSGLRLRHSVGDLDIAELIIRSVHSSLFSPPIIR
jgi:hypothetical protein